MSHRMSCSITVEPVRARTKTETRRAPATWTTLKPGDLLTLIEKGMGLKRGERQVVLAEVTVTAIDLVRLTDITEDDVHSEGFPNMTPAEFITMWLDAHRNQPTRHDSDGEVLCRRIRWEYLP